MKALLPEERPVYLLLVRPSNTASSWSPNFSVVRPQDLDRGPDIVGNERGREGGVERRRTCGRVACESAGKLLRVELISEVDTIEDVGGQLTRNPPRF